MIQKYVKEDLTVSCLREIATGYQIRAEPLATIICKNIAAYAGERVLLSVTGQCSNPVRGAVADTCWVDGTAHLIPSTYQGDWLYISE